MQRFLVYDDSCQHCGNLAQSVDAVAEGWLSCRGLSDPEMIAMIESVLPDWKWQPMLVTVNKDVVRVSSGALMIVRLGLGLGPRRAFRLLASAA